MTALVHKVFSIFLSFINIINYRKFLKTYFFAESPNLVIFNLLYAAKLLRFVWRDYLWFDPIEPTNELFLLIISDFTWFKCFKFYLFSAINQIN